MKYADDRTHGADLARETDPGRISAVVNHPRGGARIAFAGEHGCFVFLNLSDGLYEARGNVLASGRGRWAHAAAKELLRRMFEEEGAREIMMAAPKGNLAVRVLIRSLKPKYLGRIEFGLVLGWAVGPVRYFFTDQNGF